MIRRKALELNLDQVQVKRIRSNTRRQQQSPQQQQHDFSSPGDSRPHQLLPVAPPQTTAGLHRYSTAIACSPQSFFCDDHYSNGNDDNFFAESSTVGCPNEELWSNIGRVPDSRSYPGGEGQQLLAMRGDSSSLSDDICGAGMMSYHATDSCRAVSSTGYRDCSEHRASNLRNGLNDRSSLGDKSHFDRPTSHDFERLTSHDYQDGSRNSHSEDSAARISDPNTAANASIPIQLQDRTFDELFF